MRKTPQYSRLLDLARHHARRRDEAEDIVQDALIAAVAAGREDFTDRANRSWIAGAIRRRAAFDARSAARRRRREARWALEAAPHSQNERSGALEEILTGLPPSLRVLAALALSGHSRAEIVYLLDLSDTALRQRIRSLKKALTAKGVAMPEPMSGLNLDLAYGSIRDALVPALRRHGAVLASHDPDGHLFFVRRSQKP